MNKSLYSLMLMDEVVAEIDKLALRMNTNRSNLVNQILAEYVSVSTPEKQIDSIFRQMEELISRTSELVPIVTPNQLYRTPSSAIGELTVNFRSQSPALLSAMASFFILWKRMEEAYISEYYEPGALVYELSDSKFVRTIALPRGRRYTEQELGKAISSYVTMFDELMKGFLSGKYTERELERRYVSYLNSGIGLV